MNSTTGSTTWQTLLHSALAAIDSLPARGVAAFDWRMGGGTVLMLRHGHRLSGDVDIFLHDAQLLPWLSPRLNDAVAALAADYAEESASLKLTFAEGEVDFVVAPTLLALAAVPLPFAGRVVLTEPSAEIVAKKAFYRGASLKIRDVVDLALVLRREPESGPLLAPILRSVRPVLERRLALLAPTFAERLRTEVHLLPAGETEAAGSLEALRSFLGGLGSP